MADSTSTSGAINFTGLGSGTDFNQLIEGLIKVENNRVVRLERWKLSWETKREQFKNLNTQMLSLKTTLEGFNSKNKFMAKAVASNDTSILTASANADAQEGSHTIQVGQLATSDVLITTSGANALDSSITSADTSFTFSYGGTSYTINNISAGTTLEGFVNIINNHADSRGKIQATTLYDGSTYHLQLTGVDQGSDNQLIISNAGSIIFGSGDFTETQNAQNAQIKVNGFPASNAGWIERDSNVIDDIIQGVELNLKNSAPNSLVSLTVATDKDAIAENVTSFVEAVNAVRTYIMALTEVDSDAINQVSLTNTDNADAGGGSILTGNYGIDIISQKLKNITANMGIGFAVWDPDTLTGDKYSSLPQLGILTDAEDGSTTFGLLKIDFEKLYEALDDDPDAVASLFASEPTGVSLSPDFTAMSVIEGTTHGGTFDINIVSDGTQITSATINGEPAKISGWEITQLTGPASGLAVRLDNTSAGTHSGQISVKTGKANEMIDELEDLTRPYNEITYEGGPLAVLRSNYKDIMDSIDDKIDYESKRITRMETQLRLKYARLDALLGQYELRQGQLNAATAQLP